MNDLTPTLTRVTATFSVGAGAYGECHIDVTGLTPDEIAAIALVETDVSTSLCHQCAGNISDPEIEDLTGFRVGDVEYTWDGGHWVVYQP
jgi:hypothetical protein